jgi:glyoxylase-like metal-dependent hydrolase (beta-lactamase superfamily II)
MPAIREPGLINENTTMLDIGMLDRYGFTALYLIRGSRTCLIDTGTRTEAPYLVRKLTEINAFPPDVIILTHPHWDHTQGLPLIRQLASNLGKKIEVFASGDAIPLLADPSFNDVYPCGPYESIQDVTSVEEGDSVDLGDILLRIYDVPGHCNGHIAILDEKNKNIFVGDAIGQKLGENYFIPPFMPPSWNMEKYLLTIEKMEKLDFMTLSLAHFGCICGEDAKLILDEAVETMHVWWQFFDRHSGCLDDNNYLLKVMRKEINPTLPEFRAKTLKKKIMYQLATCLGSVTGRKTMLLDQLSFGDTLKFLAIGYRENAGI